MSWTLKVSSWDILRQCNNSSVSKLHKHLRLVMGEKKLWEKNPLFVFLVHMVIKCSKKIKWQTSDVGWYCSQPPGGHPDVLTSEPQCVSSFMMFNFFVSPRPQRVRAARPSGPTRRCLRLPSRWAILLQLQRRLPVNQTSSRCGQ